MNTTVAPHATLINTDHVIGESDTHTHTHIYIYIYIYIWLVFKIVYCILGIWFSDFTVWDIVLAGKCASFNEDYY